MSASPQFGGTPVLLCDGCDYLTFDLMRLAEIHNCGRGALRLMSVEGLPHGAPNVRHAVLNNPLCAAIAAHVRQEMEQEMEGLREMIDELRSAP